MSPGLSTPAAVALPDGQALTPPMGFNNWNSTHCRAEFNEAMVKGIADIFVAQGLKDAGYRYVNLDDCWALPSRNASGDLVPDPARFPSGIKAVADYVHGKGLKFGIYTSAGTKTCDTSGFPGGLGHEQQDANLFASWGVDYLKYDNCNNQGVDAKQRYRAMRDALRATGRPIVLSICEWGESRPWTWASDTGHLWRTTGDIADSWSSMLSIMKSNLALHPYAGPGHWNDPDMLEVGNGGMTDTEYRTHFTMWSMMAAPLLIGTDLRTASPATLSILKNTDVIALDQDPLGRQGREVRSGGGQHVVVKPLANGDVAVALFNENWWTSTISTNLTEIGLGAGTYATKDLWSKATGTTSGALSASVPAHGTAVYRLSRTSAPTPPPPGTSYLSDLNELRGGNGWGPIEKNRSNAEQPAGDGRVITLSGITYAKGLGAHAFGDVEYFLGGRCSTVTADVGVDDEAGDRGSVTFQLYAGSALIADSGVMTGSSATKTLGGNVSGAETLRLVVTDAGDGIDYDHADWAAARIAC
ncbi:NPCBM/NEW2 domain-containing protein [Lentzea sp. NBRC 105346]|uniref:NPCBM/NEW2 domain-containing protein n=1 Tax=Lentzea sp. NBRC 105346 TaxID=3032205 RepID=UPI0025554243|nr:NPCBM/NEW2 domain-containing protein [Lentzea sp. NBRC 105346]